MLNHRELLTSLEWFFQTEDALKTVQLLLYQGRTNLQTYRELSILAGDAENELRKELSDEK